MQWVNWVSLAMMSVFIIFFTTVIWKETVSSSSYWSDSLLSQHKNSNPQHCSYIPVPFTPTPSPDACSPHSYQVFISVPPANKLFVFQAHPDSFLSSSPSMLIWNGTPSAKALHSPLHPCGIRYRLLLCLQNTLLPFSMAFLDSYLLTAACWLNPSLSH